MKVQTRYEVDTRPIGVVLLNRLARYAAFGALGFLFVWFIQLAPLEGLTVRGQTALGVFLLCLVLWVTQLLPLAVTGLVAMVLPSVLGILEAKAVYALFGNQAVFFILGALILAAAIMESGLSTRLTLALLTRVGVAPKQLTRAVFLIALFLSCWIPEHAVAVILFPIVLEIVHALKLEAGNSRFGSGLFLAMSWGSVIGGITTFLGGARVPLALGILESSTKMSFGFFEWMTASWPITFLAGCMGICVLNRFFSPDLESTQPAIQALKEKMFTLGKMTLREKAIASIMLATVMAWISLSRQLGLANIALIGVVALFIFRLIAWKTIERYVNWGIILMYGGAIVLGVVLSETGTAAWIAHRVLGAHPTHPYLFLAGLALLVMILTEGMSNSAVVAVLLPVALGTAQVMGMNPRLLTLTVALASGLNFVLPMSTPAISIGYSAAFFRVRDVILPGLIMSISTWFFLLIVARFYWPWIGFSV